MWETFEPMPTHRGEVGVVALNDKIYVVGGHDTRYKALDVVEIFDPKTNSWSKASPMPKPIHHPGIATDGMSLYVVGGGESGWRKALNTLFIYNPETDTWSRGKDMPTARVALAAEFVNGKLYAIGGSHHWTYSTIEEYDPKTDSWVTKSPMPTPRTHMASGVIDNKIYIIAGRQLGPNSYLDVNEVYDPLEDKWTTLEPIPTARSGMAYSVANKTIFVFGGETDEHIFEETDFYIPEKGWYAGLPMSIPRHAAGAAFVDDKIYVIGGGVLPRAALSNFNEAYYNPVVIPEFSNLSVLTLVVAILIFLILFQTKFQLDKKSSLIFKKLQ